MVFFCFSSQVRHTYVRAVMYHLKNYGFETWYDHHKLILGDNKRESIIDNGIIKSKYAIIFYSTSFFTCKEAMEEERKIMELYKERKIYIFPLLCEITFKDLPEKHQNYLENIIYNEVSNNNVLSTVNQICVRIMREEIRKNSINKTFSTERLIKELHDRNIISLLEVYDFIDCNNFNARISILYCIYLYLSNDDNATLIPHCKKTIQWVSKLTKLNVEYDFKEIELMELAILILLEANRALLFLQ